MERQNPRTYGKSKSIQTKSHNEAYTYTLKLTKRVKGKKNIYIYKRKRTTKSTNKSTNKNKLYILN